MKLLKPTIASFCLLPLAGCYYPVPYSCPQPVAYATPMPPPAPDKMHDDSNYYQLPEKPTSNDYHR